MATPECHESLGPASWLWGAGMLPVISGRLSMMCWGKCSPLCNSPVRQYCPGNVCVLLSIIRFSCMLGVDARARASDSRITAYPREMHVCAASSCPAPAPLPAHRWVLRGPGRRGPQNGEATDARDQRQCGGQTEQERVEGLHRVDLLQPLGEDMGKTPLSSGLSLPSRVFVCRV
jgi:hypothetical protein